PQGPEGRGDGLAGARQGGVQLELADGAGQAPEVEVVANIVAQGGVAPGDCQPQVVGSAGGAGGCPRQQREEQWGRRKEFEQGRSRGSDPWLLSLVRAIEAKPNLRFAYWDVGLRLRPPRPTQPSTAN